MVDLMINNESRNTLIVGLATVEVTADHKVLILCKRREHCKKLMEKLESLGAWYADSDDKDRTKVLLRMRGGLYNFNILIGTLALLGTGLDIPVLDTCIICGDLKSDVLCQQGAGRVLRLFEGKETAKIYDLFDNLNPIFKNQFYQRRKFYQSQKWEIKI
jgi:superfamily II DNA or RNA helicase